MKTNALTILLLVLAFTFCGLANAGVAIDGKEYKQTIPVTPENYTEKFLAATKEDEVALVGMAVEAAAGELLFDVEPRLQLAT